jgi:single-stranded DNA-binding protein
MGSRGINSFNGSGHAFDEVYGSTSGGTPACSFMLVVEDKGEKTTRIRVNVYGGLVRVCKNLLRPGVYVVVTGELMNRGRDLTEIRARDLAFPKQST